MVRGMYDSFVENGSTITLDQFLTLPYMADMEDLLNKFDFQNGHPERVKKKNMGDCTIIVKDINNEEEDDLYIAHNTHNTYSIMLRLFKSVTIEWDEYSDFMKAKTMRFSSRYGGIASKDDFYALDSGIVAMESSILIYNNELYKRIYPESVPYFVSVTVANWMSNTNEEWIDNYLNHYGGTHIAQWVLIDTKKEKYSPGSINVLDAIMGDSEAFDVSKEFKAKGYWGGYNVPFSQRIFEECHYDPVNHGYNTDERARIIASKIGEANTPESIRSLIRYNGNPSAPCGSISPRCDLSEKGGSAFGAIDSKYTQATWIKNGSIKVLGVGAPTWNIEEGFPPFKFSGRYKDVPHRETPEELSFGWHEIFSSNKEPYSY
mmetsp:Transcript_544/g.542  ORF Transcript_544/g.542 Transcript_544/m.542 type:complete len:376 (-) Transcript_544:91-1218(-)|eukprot:CAMPEP_0197009350 /NCGR_PEP_ID=MMETSP1380-20130617/49767_1 /TAXON_ID=5936 /ORGANISM="Euplotes crassus, Strain CT5" /LENGTH=375 /DNA_ID=CAMNT_0042430543 /DNA_START=526 /DNA_END=1653 /DNA_ORIENTATION=+